MTFRVPSVIVYQEFLNATPTVTAPFFDLCIVGPCYQVNENASCLQYKALNGVYRSQYPELRTGAVLDENFTTVTLSDIYVRRWPEARSANVNLGKIEINNYGYDVDADVYKNNIEAYKEALAAGTNSTILEKETAMVSAFDGLSRISAGASEEAFHNADIKPDDYVDIIFEIGNADTPERYYRRIISTSIGSLSTDGNTLALKKNIMSKEDFVAEAKAAWEVEPSSSEIAAVTVKAVIKRQTGVTTSFAASYDSETGELKEGTAVTPNTTWYVHSYDGRIATDITAYADDPIETAKWAVKTGFKLATNLSVATAATEGDTAYIAEASVAVSYRALRKDVAGDFTTVTSYSNAVGLFGEVNYNNPISVACYMVSQAMSDMSYKVLPIVSDDNSGYTKALDILTNDEDVYVIVPLSQDKSVISSYAAHCKAMSEPEKSMWRICYGSQPMPATKIIVDRSEGSIVPGTADVVFLKDTDGQFITNIARPEDFIDIYETDSNNKTEYKFSLKIIDVINDSVAKCSDVKWIKSGTEFKKSDDKYTDFGTNGRGKYVTYEVVRALDIQGQADAISSIAESFDNKRLRLVYPDQILLTINDVNYLCPSYYMCVTLGAMRAGYAPHQGFSTMGLSGINRIYHSNKYFTDDQLANMAGNGVFWVCQDTVEALPYVLYQTTTCTDSLEVAEDSCVATVDYASKFYKNNLKSVLGKYNVNTISLNYVSNIINSCSDKMVTTSYEFIGPILTSATLVDIQGIKDKIKPTIKIEIPYPVNGVDVTLQV